MPSERFLKLKEDKKGRILEASLNEFTAEGYNDASINQIIKGADISRGSFYTYFEDKRDLFEFIFDKLKRSAFEEVKRFVIDNDGDIFIASKQMMEKAFAFNLPSNDQMMRLYDKLISDFNIIEHLNGLTSSDKTTVGILLKMFDELYEIIGEDIKQHVTLNEFYAIADMLITVSIRSLVLAKKIPKYKDEIKEKLFYEYDIMERGVRNL